MHPLANLSPNPVQSTGFYNAIVLGKGYDQAYIDGKMCQERSVAAACVAAGRAPTVEGAAAPVFFELPNHAEVRAVVIEETL
jgi:hypothetical protein